MRSRLRRTRRPLLALLALVVALIIGYAVQGARGGSGSPGPSPAPTTSTSQVTTAPGR